MKRLDAYLLTLGRRVGAVWVRWTRTSTAVLAGLLFAVSAAFGLYCVHLIVAGGDKAPIGSSIWTLEQIYRAVTLLRRGELGPVQERGMNNSKARFVCLWLSAVGLAVVGWLPALAGTMLPAVGAIYVYLAKLEPEPLAEPAREAFA